MDLDRGPQADAVQIMTLHSAKGLEFPLVFLPGWEEGVFPSQRSMDEKGEKGLEEERRLAYVGITRAREEARVSFAANRQVYGRWTSQLPSRFVDELPLPNVEAFLGDRLLWRRPRHAAARQPLGRDAPASAAATPRLAGGAPRPPATVGQPPRPASQVIEGEGRLVATSAVSAASDYKRGDRVFHLKFGYGRRQRRRRQQADGGLRKGRREEGYRQLRGEGAGGLAPTAHPRRGPPAKAGHDRHAARDQRHSPRRGHGFEPFEDFDGSSAGAGRRFGRFVSGDLPEDDEARSLIDLGRPAGFRSMGVWPAAWPAPSSTTPLRCGLSWAGLKPSTASSSAKLARHSGPAGSARRLTGAGTCSSSTGLLRRPANASREHGFTPAVNQ